ncbi:MAG: serine/threonine protein kinase, partial [Planctomycetota bacterium]
AGRTPEGQHWTAAEWVEGESLEAKLRDGALDPQEALRIGESLARTLAAAHEAGFVHLNLSPAKILIDVDGEPWLRGFGFAVEARELRDWYDTPPQDATNRYAYLAPEQVWGRYSVAGRPSDIYALGAVLYAMLTGRPPHVAPSWDDYRDAMEGDDPELPSRRNQAVPAGADTVVLRCLETGRLWRYQRAEEVADDLARVRRGEAPTPLARTCRDRLARWMEQREILLRRVTIAAGLFVLLGIPALLMAFGPDGSETEAEAKEEAGGKDGKKAADAAKSPIFRPPQARPTALPGKKKRQDPPPAVEFDADALALEATLEDDLANKRFRWERVFYSDFKRKKLPDPFDILFCRGTLLLTPNRGIVDLTNAREQLAANIDEKRLVLTGKMKQSDGYSVLHYTRPIGASMRIVATVEDIGETQPILVLGGDGFTGRRVTFAFQQQYVQLDTIDTPEHTQTIFLRVPCTFDPGADKVKLTVERVGPLVRAFVDGERVLVWNDPDPPSGEKGATCALATLKLPCQFVNLAIFRGKR